MNATALVKPVEEFAAPVENDNDRVQRVAMGKEELQIYIEDGRPKGALFKSVADLKGLSAKSISSRAKVPVGVVQAVLNDGAMSAVTTSAILSIAEAIGINLQSLCLTEGQVHVFDLRKFQGAIAKRVAARAVGLLMRGAIVARLDPKSALRYVALSGFAEYHAAQSGASRAVFVTSAAPLFGSKFEISTIPSARWMGGNSMLPVAVESAELSSLLYIKNLNRIEFDQLFKGADKTSWNEIQSYSREHNISRAEVMELMKFASGEFDQKAPEAPSKGQKAPVLRLVSVKAA